MISEIANHYLIVIIHSILEKIIIDKTRKYIDNDGKVFSHISIILGVTGIPKEIENCFLRYMEN